MRNVEKIFKSAVYFSGLTVLLCGSAHAGQQLKVGEKLINVRGQELPIARFDFDGTPIVMVGKTAERADLNSVGVESGCTDDGRFCVGSPAYDRAGHPVNVKAIFPGNNFSYQPNAKDAKSFVKVGDAGYGGTQVLNDEGKFVAATTDDHRLRAGDWVYDMKNNRLFVGLVYSGNAVGTRTQVSNVIAVSDDGALSSPRGCAGDQVGCVGDVFNYQGRQMVVVGVFKNGDVEVIEKGNKTPEHFSAAQLKPMIAQLDPNAVNDSQDDSSDQGTTANDSKGDANVGRVGGMPSWRLGGSGSGN